MQPLTQQQGYTLKPLGEPNGRHAHVTCDSDRTTASLYEHGHLVAVMSHCDRQWIYEQAEVWLDRDT